VQFAKDRDSACPLQVSHQRTANRDNDEGVVPLIAAQDEACRRAPAAAYAEAK